MVSYEPISNDDDIELDEMEESEPKYRKREQGDSLTLSIIPTTDDVQMPSLTWRAVLIGTIWCLFLGICNSILAFRTNAFWIPSFLATLLSYPMGTFFAAIIPAGTLRILWWDISLNPGPFSIKEHVLITIIANAGGSLAYGIDNVVAQKSSLFMGNDSITFFESLCWVLTTQLIGFGFAGLARRYLVYPKEMIWPGILSTVALFVGFHSNEIGTSTLNTGLSRFKFFWIACGLCFLYTWVPQYFFVALQSISSLCLLGFGEKANFFFSSDNGYGIGVGSITFDWYYIGGNSLTTPFWASINFAISNFFWLILLTKGVGF
jgi:OPT family oligopeptide transporter